MDAYEIAVPVYAVVVVAVSVYAVVVVAVSVYVVFVVVVVIAGVGCVFWLLLFVIFVFVVIFPSTHFLPGGFTVVYSLSFFALVSSECDGEAKSVCTDNANCTRTDQYEIRCDCAAGYFGDGFISCESKLIRNTISEYRLGIPPGNTYFSGITNASV